VEVVAGEEAEAGQGKRAESSLNFKLRASIIISAKVRLPYMYL
jgi:hypothetical protein